VLRVYARENSGAPQRVDLNSFLRPDDDYPEADIEGGTRIGDRIFWIASTSASASFCSADLFAISDIRRLYPVIWQRPVMPPTFVSGQNLCLAVQTGLCDEMLTPEFIVFPVRCLDGPELGSVSLRHYPKLSAIDTFETSLSGTSPVACGANGGLGH
jgi:hypothetical protein